MKNKFPFKFGDKVHLWGYITKKKNSNMVILRRAVGDYFWCADATTYSKVNAFWIKSGWKNGKT
jgi:hypothetical protein